MVSQLLLAESRVTAMNMKPVLAPQPQTECVLHALQIHIAMEPLQLLAHLHAV